MTLRQDHAETPHRDATENAVTPSRTQPDLYSDETLHATATKHASNGLGREARILLTVPADQRRRICAVAHEYSNRTGDRYNDCLEIEARRA